MAHETERYSLHLPRDFWPLVDAWRRLQPDLPTRAEAVRRLVAAGINSTDETLKILDEMARRHGVDVAEAKQTIQNSATPKEPKASTDGKRTLAVGDRVVLTADVSVYGRPPKTFPVGLSGVVCRTTTPVYGLVVVELDDGMQVYIATSHLRLVTKDSTP